jgi:hypothetical protein
MANVLKVSIQEAIRSLAERGWTHRRIARELKLNRRTVARYAGPAKCTTISTPGPEPGTKGRERPRAGQPEFFRTLKQPVSVPEVRWTYTRDAQERALRGF